MDLVIRNAVTVTVGGRARGDIGIKDGRIAQLGGEMSADDEIDAAGRFVLPGGIDPHVHLTPPARGDHGWAWVDDFESGTRAAVAGGITTVGNISFPGRGETIADAIATDGAEAGELAVADFFLHPVLMDPDEANLAAIDQIHAEGHTSVKIFLSFRRFDRQVSEYLEAMRRIKAAGGIALIHCEDAAIIDCCCTLLREEGNTDPSFYPAARPLQAEVVATQRAVGFAETTDCPIYVVHLASERALDACRDGRSRGVAIYVETRPLYIHLTSERFNEPDGAKYAGAPPLREQRDVDAMWAGLRFGDVDVLATDHAPWMLADKLDPTQEAMDMKQGVADLETMLPMLWSSGVRTGRLTVEQFVAVTSTNPAKLFGLYPHKGTIAVGADADLVIWNEDETRIVDGASMQSNSDFTPYDGWEVTGWPAVTISRGDVVARGAEVIAERGRGRFAQRGAHRAI
ncbi:MAG: dihydropyrimidinase [Candidatus Poriferisodalaceae bacterium]|jgi:dihydropyrimidinase